VDTATVNIKSTSPPQLGSCRIRAGSGKRRGSASAEGRRPAS
jgi:hypothetical protein